MIKLTEVTIHKYKSFENDQTFQVEDDITILVGMNESGKTSAIEAIAKTNYFEDDAAFKFDLTHDFPRREKKAIDKSGTDPEAVTLKFLVSAELLSIIEKDLGKGVFTNPEFTRTTKFSNGKVMSVKSNIDAFFKHQISVLSIPDSINLKPLKTSLTLESLNSIIALQEDGEVKAKLEELSKYFKNKWKWTHDLIGEYISRVYLQPHLPKYLYYDEYYSLPSRISITSLKSKTLEAEELKTAKALLELADINTDAILNAKNFENFKAELEATEAIISDVLFKYWKTNRNLSIEFEIDKITKKDGNNNETIVDHVLDIRVKNSRARVSLPLKNRSKGFNWFFSFLVWFKKIQEDKNSTYVLLLDEPGLNLHAAAQADLLEFLNDLSKDYQIIYTTHSPFMIESDKLQKVRTVLESETGSKISDSIQEKDPNTLFPLQAALGYNIAQNLFISKNNLLVEGASDLLYLQVMSAILQAEGRTALDENITIVPVGGLDKVATFISLLRSNDLNIVCLLDTFTDAKGKARLDDLIEKKIVSGKKIRFFHEFLPGYTTADIEDIFTKEDYLKFYNEAFPSTQLKLSDLNAGIKPILVQITQKLKIDGFNHYRPANALAKLGVDDKYFSKDTLDRFEAVFIAINKLFK